MKRIAPVILAAVIALSLAACSGTSKSELIKKLYNELEVKTEECNRLLENNEELELNLSSAEYWRESIQYERDAFLQENIEIRICF